MKFKNEKTLSIADRIRYLCSIVVPGISYTDDNYKNIPLIVAILICAFFLAVIIGFIFVAISILTSR